GYGVARQWGCDGELFREVARWYRNALKTHPGAILACRFCCCVLPLCQIALIPQPHPAMSAYVINNSVMRFTQAKPALFTWLNSYAYG
ncbi:hypothetical protein NL760_RS24370, partial [Escherichia coli]